MKKNSTTLDEKEYQAHAERLEALARVTLGTLSDEAVLELLAERRTLEKEKQVYEQAQAEEQKRTEVQALERTTLQEALQKLNAAITPDKDDEALLALVAERKEVEAKLKALGEESSPKTTSLSTDGMQEAAEIPGEARGAETPSEAPDKTGEGAPVETALPEAEESVSSDTKAQDMTEVRVDTEGAAPESVSPDTKPDKVLDERIGGERIHAVLSSAEADDFLKLLEGNPDEALSRLESLPDDLKKDRSFMLRVALVDPAYAMHYADAKTLKKDEEFNVKVAGLQNPRNSGNPLAEMLSEARTAKVVLAAVKTDFRNLRYATQEMEGYAEILEIGKKEAREKVQALGQAVDLRMFLPKVLRDDHEFLLEMEGLVKGLKEKKSSSEVPKEEH